MSAPTSQERGDGEAHRALADRAHRLAMAVLQSDHAREYPEEIRDVLEMVDAYGEPVALSQRPPALRRSP